MCLAMKISKASVGPTRFLARSAFTLIFLVSVMLGAPNCGAEDVTIPVNIPGGASLQVPATIFKPEGSGPFPAVVIMHDCSGLGPSSSGAPGHWAELLVANGYVAILPDSFSPRGLPGGVCTVPVEQRRRADAGTTHRARDAYAALAYLKTLPYVDGSRVGLMGGSNGGSTTLQAMVSDQARQGGGFRGAVALYPECAARMGDWGEDMSRVYKPVSPLLILIGELDDWTPAAHCRKLAAASQQAGFPVTIEVYPGAYHSFDSDHPVRFSGLRVNGNAPSGHGATTGGQPAAWAESKREVLSFFAMHLAMKPMDDPKREPKS
jgi:dienelactone hydrolase